MAIQNCPVLSTPNGEENVAYFRRLVLKRGCTGIMGRRRPRRFANAWTYEMGMIEQMGYVNYYLIVHDFVRYAKSIAHCRWGPGGDPAPGVWRLTAWASQALTPFGMICCLNGSSTRNG